MLVSTMGSDFWPLTPEGRVLALLLSVYGLAVFGYITASFVDAARLIHELRKSEGKLDAAPIEGVASDALPVGAAAIGGAGVLVVAVELLGAAVAVGCDAVFMETQRNGGTGTFFIRINNVAGINPFGLQACGNVLSEIVVRQCSGKGDFRSQHAQVTGKDR